jgi:hypothetical protein
LNDEVGVSTALEDYGISGEKEFSERVREALWTKRGKNFLLAAHLKRSWKGGGREGGGGRDVHVCSRAVSVWRKEEEKRTC